MGRHAVLSSPDFQRGQASSSCSSSKLTKPVFSPLVDPAHRAPKTLGPLSGTWGLEAGTGPHPTAASGNRLRQNLKPIAQRSSSSGAPATSLAPEQDSAPRSCTGIRRSFSRQTPGRILFRFYLPDLLQPKPMCLFRDYLLSEKDASDQRTI